TGVLYVPYLLVNSTQFQIQAIVTDVAGNTTTQTAAVIVDVASPVIQQPAFVNLSGKPVSAIADQSVITPTSTLNLALRWSKVLDSSPLQSLKVHYTVDTIQGAIPYTQTLTTSALQSTPLTGLSEASRVTAQIQSTDIFNNKSTTPLGNIYLDSALTPDYTAIDKTGPIYRGWLNQGCSALARTQTNDVNRRAQQFAATWDSQYVRFNWQGADWNNDGDLFIYIDSIAGGTVDAFRPFKYTQTITDSIASGISIITLPSNFAARAMSATGSIADTLNANRAKLIQSQTNRTRSVVQGADYVIYIPDTRRAELWKWDSTAAGGTGAWVITTVIPEYLYSQNSDVLHSDIRISKANIGYVSGTPFGVVSYATTEAELLPWMTFPTTNPTSAAMADRKIAFTPLINGYSWANLNDGLCPNRSVKNPDTTLVKATLSSTPAGVNTQAVYGEFGNTDADAIQSAIRQTTEVCAKAPTIPWCQAVDYFLNVGNAGTQVVSSLFATADANSTPYIGNDSVVTYTLTIANDQLNTTKMLYAIVETYGPVWLTAVNTPNTRPISIIAGGIYNYHTIVNPQLRDYVVLQIA
ncbi:MAG: hypothetical protein ACK48C_04400, partial [Roseiflexaceae bacterium]